MTIIEGVLDVPIMMIPFTIILSIYAIILIRTINSCFPTKEQNIQFNKDIEYTKHLLKLQQKKLYEDLLKQIEDEKNNK
jgi:hypothetical protein